MENFDYSEKRHECVLETLEHKFKGTEFFKAEGFFKGVNSVIIASIQKSDKCRLALILDFGKDIPYEEKGCLVCAYTNLDKTKAYLVHHVVGWDNAITKFESLVDTLDASSVEAVMVQFESL